MSDTAEALTTPAATAAVYFVTGAAGFVGRHVCRRLRERGYRVHAVVRREDAELARLGMRVWVGDLWHDEALKDAIRDAEVVIHCAGDPRFGNGAHYYRANVELTRRLLDAAREHAHRLNRFVFVSTIGAVDRAKDDACDALLTEESSAFPSSDYGRSKLEAERMVRDSGLAFAIVRPALVVGDDMRGDSHFAVFARRALSGHVIGRIAWPGKFSVVHIDDLADGIITAATHPKAAGQTLFCAGSVVSLTEFFDQCRRDVRRLPLAAVSTRARRYVRWAPFSLKALLLPALTASDDRLRALGWRPRHSAPSALAPVIARERARLDPDITPGGQTVITGAASGLGRALVGRLASRRDRLLLVDKDAARLAAVARQCANCATRVVDLSDAGQVEALLGSTEWNAHPITELYACAGIGSRGRMQDVPADDHRRMFAVNVLARIALTKSAIDGMRSRHFGRVVLISSSSAFQPLPYMATYAATNAALLSLGEAWSAETAGDGVHVMTVCPGGMKTDFQKSGGVREVEGESLMTPEDVAAAIVQGLRYQKMTLIVSFRSFAMSMLARALPRRASVALWYRLMKKLR